METKTGKVDAVSRNRKGIKIGEDWYNTFQPVQAEVEENALVTFEYEKKPGEKPGVVFNDIIGAVRVQKPETPSECQWGPLLAACHKEVTRILGREPQGEELRLVSTLFIRNAR